MPKVIVIKNMKDINVTIKTLNRIKKRLPKMTTDTMLQWGKMLEKSMKDSAKLAGIKKFTGTLYKRGIEWRQRPRGKTGKLFIRLYGVYLDSMNSHYVNVLRRRSKLLQWALQANNPNIRRNALQVQNRTRQSFPLYVRQKPFIQRGYRRVRRRLKPMLARMNRLAVSNA